ncbi:MAG TPA: hypothetical protein VIG32_01915, partial [Candidatus Baltobacteraceae bacterium]
NTIATMGTFVVIAASAVAALIQLRHMSAGNQLDAILSLERDFRSEPIQNALRFVQTDLPARLKETQYRSELETRGFVDSRVHLELDACNWFNTMGGLLKNRLVSEKIFMDLFGRLIVYYWSALTPVVALMRRERGNVQYHDFEYLAIRAKDWLAHNPEGTFPPRTARESITDPFIEA